MNTASWVIKRKSDGMVLLETYNKRLVDRLNTTRYEAVPILDYLYSLNRPIREQEAMLQRANEKGAI